MRPLFGGKRVLGAVKICEAIGDKVKAIVVCPQTTIGSGYEPIVVCIRNEKLFGPQPNSCSSAEHYRFAIPPPYYYGGAYRKCGYSELSNTVLQREGGRTENFA